MRGRVHIFFGVLNCTVRPWWVYFVGVEAFWLQVQRSGVLTCWLSICLVVFLHVYHWLRSVLCSCGSALVFDVYIITYATFS